MSQEMFFLVISVGAVVFLFIFFLGHALFTKDYDGRGKRHEYGGDSKNAEEGRWLGLTDQFEKPRL